jgi:hypothetical protein
MSETTQSMDALGIEKIRAEISNLIADTMKLNAETRGKWERDLAETEKLRSEARKLDRDWRLHPVTIASAFLTASAIFCGAVLALAKHLA